MRTPAESVPVLVIGAGVHGLSTAWHLAKQGQRVLVVDKTGVAAGASGIACGVIRNNYFQPAMSELMAACVEVWESDPQALHYHGSGYIALGPPAQESDLIAGPRAPAADRLPVRAVPRRGGGRGAHAIAVRRLARPGLTVCLHERAGGFAFNKESMLGLAAKAEEAGARSSPASRSPASTRTTRARSRQSTPRPAPPDRSRSSSLSAPGSPRSGRCSTCRRGSTSASRTAP